jgi:hypothetical protein
VTDAERTLAAVLDTLVPPDPLRGMPGAGSLGLEAQVLEATRSIAAVVSAGFAELGAAGFAALAPAARRDALEALAASQPAFVPNLVFHTYQAYYQHPRVLEALGLEPRPPHPLGYDAPENDLSLLEAVRARGPLWRSPG